MEIYKHLCEHTQSTVSELVTLVGLTQPTISYHLKEMKDHGILKSSRNGKEVYYSVSKTCPHYEDACVLSFIQFPKES